MSAIKINARDLLEKNSVNLEGKAGDFSSYSFWYYTSLDTASKILQSNGFHVSNFEK